MLSQVPWPLPLGNPDQVEPVDATVVACFEWLLFALMQARGKLWNQSGSLSLTSTSFVLLPLFQAR